MARLTDFIVKVSSLRCMSAASIQVTLNSLQAVMNARSDLSLAGSPLSGLSGYRHCLNALPDMVQSSTDGFCRQRPYMPCAITS